jgi:predicted nucleotidyltransferase
MATERVLGVIAAHRGRIDALLARYGARNPQVFGSVARGDATQVSDLDLLVVLDPDGGNPLLRMAGLAEELSELLQVRVDVVADELLRAPVSASAHANAVPL